jgi:hypothetical protein
MFGGGNPSLISSCVGLSKRRQAFALGHASASAAQGAAI